MAGFSVSDKAAKESSSGLEAVDNHGKLQNSKLLQFVPWENDDDNHARPFPPFAFCLGDDVHADGPADAVRTPQPFYISSPTTSTAHTAIKTPGRMAASLEFPFTSVQCKELERQAMIYKFIKASVPVPPDLLIPINGSPSVPVASQHSALGVVAPNLTFSSSRGDLEPGRCRRTDGKKWRCSRDVALGQKYCERHIHRGRPRSRKPVELPKRKTCHIHTQALPSSSSTVLTKNTCTSQFSRTLAQPSLQNQTNCFPDKLSEKTATFWPVNSVSSYKEPKNLDWILNEELVPLASSDQRWHHLMQIGSSTTYSSFSNAGNSFVLNQNYSEELLTLNSYANLNATEDQQRSSCLLSLNSEIVSLEKCPDGTARGIIDEWSTGAETSVYSNGKLSLSSLSPSMGIDNIRDDEMGRIQIGLGVTESDQNHEHASTSHVSSWSAPASWAASTPGGPLAEVLRSSKITTAAATAATKASFNLSPLVTGNADSCSPLVTAVSSPSGVLQRTLVSLSDSSCSSSPTLGSSEPNWRSV